MTFLRVIFILILTYYLFKLVGRYLLPWLLKRFMKNVQNKYSQNAGNTNNQSKKEGEVNIKYSPKDKKNKDEDIGEYVDFEDLDN